MNPKRAKILGFYLLILAILQACLYLALSFDGEKTGWLFYFDPRIGIFYLETLLGGRESTAPGILMWLSVCALAALSILFLRGRAPLKAYVASELIMAAPSLLFFVGVAWANMSPAHGFSVGELFMPVLVFVFATVVPLIVALTPREKRAAALEGTNEHGR